MPARRRVTVVAHELRGFVPAGGMGTATAFLALAFARMGHDVELLLGLETPASMDPQWAETYARAGIRMRRVPAPDYVVEPWQFKHAHSIELALRADPPDVVVAHDFGGPAYTALCARRAGIALEDTLFVVFCHGPRRYAMDIAGNVALGDLRNVLATAVHERMSIELADVVVSPSEYLVEWMRGQGWSLPERTLVVPYFTHSTATGESPTIARDGGDGALARLSFFGRLDDRKGLTIFTEALNALEPELLSGIELDFIGGLTSAWPRERIEQLLSAATKRAVRSVSFATQLDQQEALARLGRRGTVVVMPSLQDNSPNAVYECLELELPFIASGVGGVPELIAPEEHARTLFEPTARGVETALRRLLSDGRVPLPVRPAFAGTAPLDGWAEVVAMQPRARAAHVAATADVIVHHRRSHDSLMRCLAALRRQTSVDFRIVVAAAPGTTSDGIDADEIVRAEESSVAAARAAGVNAAAAPFVLFLDEDDIPDDALLETLLQAQAANDADVVSCGVRRVEAGSETVHLFSGSPAALGVLDNGYGSVALIRRGLLSSDSTPSFAEHDPDWPLLARLSAGGASIVTVPAALLTRAAHSGTIEDDPTDALLAVRDLEAALPESLRGAARVAAGLAADAPPPTVVGARRHFRVGAIVLALTIVAAAIRLSTLGRQSYWYDELVTVSVLHRSFGEMLRAVPHTEATPYLYYVLAWPWGRLFGLGEAGLRSLSAIAGALTVPVAYAAGSALVSRRAGVITAAIVAVNPFLVWYSQEARAYALLVLIAAATFLFFARALRGDGRALVWWSVTAALALATHYFAVFVVAVEAMWLLRRLGRRARIATALPAVVLVAEIPLVVKQRHNGGNLSASPLLHRVLGIPKDLLVGYSFPAELGGTALAVVLVLIGTVFAVRRRERGALVALAVAASAAVLPILLALIGADYVIARNTIAVAVPAAVFLAAGYARHRVGIAAAALLCALSLAVVVAVAAETRYGRTDWRGAARELGPTGAARAIVATPTIDNTLLRPYLPGLQEPAPQALRVREIAVVALASQGGFSAGAVHPPTASPRPAPAGFRLASVKRSPTFVLVRYAATRRRPVAEAALAALALSPIPPAILLQRPTSEPPG